MKKQKFLVPAAVGVLTLGITGGVIFAQNQNDGEPELRQLAPSSEQIADYIAPLDELGLPKVSLSHGADANPSIPARVAEILVISEDELTNAFAQAKWDKQNDTLSIRLDHLVENEKLTREEADSIMTWFEARPEVVTQLHRVLLQGEQAVAAKLRQMVARGVISEAEAQEVMDWYQRMPEALKDLLEQRMQRFPDDRSRGQVRPEQRFQGRDMERPGFPQQRMDREGMADGRPQRPAFGEERPDRPGFSARQFPRQRMNSDAPGLDQYGNVPPTLP